MKHADDPPRRRARRLLLKTSLAYQLKMTLQHIKPPIWRRVLVPDCTIDELHEIIQIAMGWENYHLYCFRFGDCEFTHPDLDEGELNMLDSTSFSLRDVIKAEKAKFQYKYDFGDGWEHVIVVEKIGQLELGRTYPSCLKGKRACPPEDVGGEWGYARYLKAIADPRADRHEEFMRWHGKFDPEAVDLEAVNKALAMAFR